MFMLVSINNISITEKQTVLKPQRLNCCIEKQIVWAVNRNKRNKKCTVVVYYFFYMPPFRLIETSPTSQWEILT